MKKRLILIALICCTLFCMAACSNPSRSQEAVEHPENWDINAEILRYCNGFYHAKTADQLKPYVLAETPDKQIQKYVDDVNAFLNDSAGALDYRDFPYDSVEVALLDTYKNYELFWVKATSSAFQEATENLPVNPLEVTSYANIGPNLLCLVTIENGHYVSSLDEALSKEVLEKYDYCHSCSGMGQLMDIEPVCAECGGMSMITQHTCNDCGEVSNGEAFNNEVSFLQPVITPEAGDGVWSWEQAPSDSEESDVVTGLWIGGNPAGIGNTCPVCESSNVTTTSVPCVACSTEDSNEDPSICPTCNGKGWIKK